MKNIIVSKEDFLKTYKNKAYGYKAIKLCKKNKWLPTKSSKELASIIGRLMGDGNLSKDPMVGDFRFYGNRDKLDKIKKLLKEKFKLDLYKYYLHPKKGGYILKYNNAIFSRILELTGVPRGDKILKAFKVPNWIMKGDKKVKKAFLSAIFADEMGKISKRKSGGWNGLGFGMSKIEEKSNHLIYFLNQLRYLLKEFHITSSDVRLRKDSEYHRKDGNVTYQAVFEVHINRFNRERFYSKVGFDDEEKQKLLYMSVREPK